MGASQPASCDTDPTNMFADTATIRNDRMTALPCAREDRAQEGSFETGAAAAKLSSFADSDFRNGVGDMLISQGLEARNKSLFTRRQVCGAWLSAIRRQGRRACIVQIGGSQHRVASAPPDRRA